MQRQLWQIALRSDACSREAESEFLSEFRLEALRWGAHAAAAGALLYASFIVIAWLLELHTTGALVIRGGLVAMLAAVSYCMSTRSGVGPHNYVPIAAVTSAVALGGAVLLLTLRDGEMQAVAVQASPAIMFGLFLHYAFLRLPLKVSATVGWSVAAAAVFWAPAVTGGSEMLRNAVYLSFANVFGMIVSRLGENRERELFHQRREAEAARAVARERQAAAEEANAQKTRLIAAVSHDLRQPMTAAISYLEVTRARLHASDDHDALAPAEKAQAAVSMLGATLDHLLTAARYDSGTEALNIEPVELGPLLRDIHDGYIDEAEMRGVRLRVRLPRERVLLTTDRRSLHRVIGNLVSNAIKFTDARETGRGRVLIAAQMHGGRCRIHVIDTGIGIEHAQLQEVWKPYVQLNNTERDREHGLGLGLYLVQRIVQQLPDHSVSLRSRPGHGSRFTLAIPGSTFDRSAVRRPAARPSAAPLDLSPLRGAYVLLLEDDRDTRLSMVALLSQWGVLPTACSTAAELLSIGAESDRLVDAIVCDYRLAGGVNGIDAIARLRDRLGYAPHAVLVTGEPDIAPLRARAGPETTVLHKPFTPESFATPLLRAVHAARVLEEG
ncbi:MAG: ATP-binding protein [Burkholderiales bacterium]|nr:ATP-binding protein [Burkholderiales bacterium]